MDIIDELVYGKNKNRIKEKPLLNKCVLCFDRFPDDEIEYVPLTGCVCKGCLKNPDFTEELLSLVKQ